MSEVQRILLSIDGGHLRWLSHGQLSRGQSSVQSATDHLTFFHLETQHVQYQEMSSELRCHSLPPFISLCFRLQHLFPPIDQRASSHDYRSYKYTHNREVGTCT